jgi:hypothetical protein
MTNVPSSRQCERPERQPLDDKNMCATLLPARMLHLHRTLQCDVFDYFLTEVIRNHTREILWPDSILRRSAHGGKSKSDWETLSIDIAFEAETASLTTVLDTQPNNDLAKMHTTGPESQRARLKVWCWYVGCAPSRRGLPPAKLWLVTVPLSSHRYQRIVKKFHDVANRRESGQHQSITRASTLQFRQA